MCQCAVEILHWEVSSGPPPIQPVSLTYRCSIVVTPAGLSSRATSQTLCRASRFCFVAARSILQRRAPSHEETLFPWMSLHALQQCLGRCCMSKEHASGWQAPCMSCLQLCSPTRQTNCNVLCILISINQSQHPFLWKRGNETNDLLTY